MTSLAIKICTPGSITANHFMSICAKFVRYIMVVKCPTNLNYGAWSHTPVTFHDNADKKLECHNSTESHKQAILGLVNLHIEDTIGSWAKEKSQERHEANNLYIGKLICIVHFLPRNILPVKSLYQKFIEFLSNELEEPIIKQHL